MESVKPWLLTFCPTAPCVQIEHSEQEWQSLLTPAQYATLRQAVTEPPRSSPLYTVGAVLQGNTQHSKSDYGRARCIR